MDSLKLSQNCKKSSLFSFFWDCCKPNSHNDVIRNISLNAPTSTMYSIKSTVNDTPNHSETFESKSRFSIPSTRSNNKDHANNKNIYCKGKIYPKDELFILGEGNQKILAKITEVKLKRNFLDSTMIIHENTNNTNKTNIKKLKTSMSFNTRINFEELRESEEFQFMNDSLYSKKEIFSLVENGIKVDNWEEITPEVIADHIAKRLKCQLILDALCGVGGNTVQFAKYSNFVIGIDIEPTKVIYAKHNSRIYSVENKIDFFIADFLKMRNLTASIVFYAPSELRTKGNNDQLSIFNNFVPNMIDVTGKALEISYSLAFKLPKTIDFEELPLLFNKSFIKHETYSKRFCIEIEAIYIDDELDCYMIYFGDCSSINPEEEYQKIYEFICENEAKEWSNMFPLSTVKNIIQKVGMFKSLKLLFDLSIYNHTNYHNGPYSNCHNGQCTASNHSLFDSFMELISNQNILTAEDIKRIRNNDNVRVYNNSVLTASNSSIDHSNNQQQYTLAIKSHFNSAEKGFQNSPNRKNRQDSQYTFGEYYTNEQRLDHRLNSLEVNTRNLNNHPHPHEVSFDGLEKIPQANFPYYNDSASANDKLVELDINQLEIDFIDSTNDNKPKNSYELSDMGLSSYSVSSGFFKESLTDEGVSPINEAVFDDILHLNSHGEKEYDLYHLKEEDNKGMSVNSVSNGDIMNNKRYKKAQKLYKFNTRKIVSTEDLIKLKAPLSIKRVTSGENFNAESERNKMIKMVKSEISIKSGNDKLGIKDNHLLEKNSYKGIIIDGQGKIKILYGLGNEEIRKGIWEMGT